jgi:hypothetical protein
MRAYQTTKVTLPGALTMKWRLLLRVKAGKLDMSKSSLHYLSKRTRSSGSYDELGPTNEAR